MKMLIQEALTELKLIRNKIQSATTDLGNWSTVVDADPKHPWGEKNGSYNIDYAKIEVEAKLQSAKDLLERYAELKAAIDYTNMVTLIEVAGQKITVAQAIIMRRMAEGKTNQPGYAKLKKDLFQALKNCIEHAVARANNLNRQVDQNQLQIKKADLIYLYDVKKMTDAEMEFEQFLSELDAKLQVINATTELLYPTIESTTL